MLGTGSIDGELTFNSFITDGIRLTVTEAFAAAYVVIGKLFFGSALSFFVGEITNAGSDGGTSSKTGLGWQPTDVFFASTNSAFGTSAIGAAQSKISHGIASKHGADSITQGAFA